VRQASVTSKLRIERLMIVAGGAMKSEWESHWESMTIDELFELREMMQDVLSERLKAKKAEIERRLQTLNRLSSEGTKSSNPKTDQ
jgi:hypothetical protein